MPRLLGLLVAGVIGTMAGAAQALPVAGAYPTVEPLTRAHAHNDYEHPRPLFDALDHGFTGVEADIWLVGGDLLVAHNAEDLRPDRTLRGLYLDPLRDFMQANAGSVYPQPSPFRLLIDVKSEAEPTYAALHDTLGEYADMLTLFGPDDTIEQGAVTAIVSGNRAREAMKAEETRLAAYDGRLSDLNSGEPASFIPLISDNWTKNFSWMGEGMIPGAEWDKLLDIVAQAHANYQELRFWATPDAPGPTRNAIWETLLRADVDLINTDDLAGLQAFLLAHGEGGAGQKVPEPATLVLLGCGLLGSVLVRRRRSA